MKLTVDNKNRTIEFKYITGQHMLEEIKRLFLEYARSLETDLAFQDFETEFQTLPGKYVPPEGALILALVDGKGAGCIALRKISDSICEMKRLYVNDAYRGLGIGKNLIMMIIEEARKLHYRYIRLDTLPTMEKAQEMYLSFGFYDIEPYVYNPIEGTRFLELKLTGKKDSINNKNLDPGPFYHGTKADLKAGDLLEPGYNSNYGSQKKANYVYLTATLDAAIWGAELALGEGSGRIYRVEPTGAFEDDPNLTDKKFPGNPTRSYRTRQPLRIVDEIPDWEGHSPEVLQKMRDSLEELKRQGIEAINE